jgi:3-oxoacyl-[acyl-carrier-protein] synthase II
MVNAMRMALADAGIGPEEVDHINAHATATKYNDSIETAAIKTVFGERAYKIPVNGIKSMLGHAMGAASSLEAIAAALTIRNGAIPPTIGLEQRDPQCDLDYVAGAARRQTVNVALSNSAGIGGANSMVVLRRYR